MTPEQREAVLQRLWPSGAPANEGVWAVLDCARDPSIYRMLIESRLEFRCLYSGRLPRALEMAAPHLLEIPARHAFLLRWLDAGWGRAWGVLLRTGEPDNLRHHLRKFLKVRDPSGRNLLFRWYDPRVLRTYLPTCTPAEQARLFGPVRAFVAEDDAGMGLVEFGLPSSVLSRESALPLAGPPTLRREQMQAFDDAALERWLSQHLAMHFPALPAASVATGAGGLPAMAIATARRWRMPDKVSIAQVANLLSLLGPGFEDDPRHAWAREALALDADAAVRLARLLAAAERQVYGAAADEVVA